MKPSFWKITSTDWPAFFCLLGIPSIWIIGALFPFIRRGAHFGASEMLTVALPISMVEAAFLAWRIARIYRMFVGGTRVQGLISRVMLARDRGRVEFIYSFAGQEYESWAPVRRCPAVLALREMQRLDILLDPTRPERAIIPHLYA